MRTIEIKRERIREVERFRTRMKEIETERV
jgi:hypothetical protein